MFKEKFYFTLILIFLLFLDLFSKFIFKNKVLFESLFIHIKYSVNYGSAFGMFSNLSYYTEFIIALSIVILIALYKFKEIFYVDIFHKISLVFLISGILGNLFDRIIYGFVRDFISFGNLFIFNLADLYLTLAVFFLVVSEIKNYLNKKN